MSRTPDTAIPEAAADEAAASPTFAQRAGGLAELVRDHPKTAIAAGAVVAAGVAAAIPLARRRSNGKGASAPRPRTGAKKKS